jgi:dTDP-4-dehydrorhamnose 3,5-epimerase
VAVECFPTSFTDAKLFRPVVHRDARGFFAHTYSKIEYAPFGIDDDFVEDSVSVSHAGVLRGLHYDVRLAKFVQVLFGSVFDVIVDLRKPSPTFGRWEGFELSSDNHLQLYVPRGFAHGFYARSELVIFCYKQSAAYDPTTEGQVLWNDPDLAIEWPIAGPPTLSEKDRSALPFSRLRGVEP